MLCRGLDLLLPEEVRQERGVGGVFGTGRWSGLEDSLPADLALGDDLAHDAGDGVGAEFHGEEVVLEDAFEEGEGQGEQKA